MTKKNDQEINWELTTWKGSRRQQHREFYALPFLRKLELIEEMCALTDELKAKNEKASLHEASPSYGGVTIPKIS